MGRKVQLQHAQSEYEEEPGDRIAQVLESRGNHIFSLRYADASVGDAAMPNKFKNTMWIRRGSYVVVRNVSGDDAKPFWSIEYVLDRGDLKRLTRSGKLYHFLYIFLLYL